MLLCSHVGVQAASFCDFRLVIRILKKKIDIKQSPYLFGVFSEFELTGVQQ